jgi:hypothetical protein
MTRSRPGGVAKRRSGLIKSEPGSDGVGKRLVGLSDGKIQRLLRGANGFGELAGLGVSGRQDVEKLGRIFHSKLLRAPGKPERPRTVADAGDRTSCQEPCQTAMREQMTGIKVESLLVFGRGGGKVSLGLQGLTEPEMALDGAGHQFERLSVMCNSLIQAA